MSEMVEQFRAYRAKMNEKILAADNKVIKRIYNLDTNTYMDGEMCIRDRDYDAVKNRYKQMVFLVEFGN